MTDKDAYVQKLHAKLDEWNAELISSKPRPTRRKLIREQSQQQFGLQTFPAALKSVQSKLKESPSKCEY
jgi:hypothetical protein